MAMPFLAQAATPDPTASLGTMNVKVTCYAPGAGGRIEGPWATSRPGPRDQGGGSFPRTLDDYRLGKSKFVTLAGHPMHYGKWFNMGPIEYVSNIDGKRYPIDRVVGYVHDTGCAFWQSGLCFGTGKEKQCSCCERDKTCGDVYRKMDIAYGKFSPGQNVGLVNNSPACTNKNATWTQIGGPLSTAPVVGPGVQVQTPNLFGPGTTSLTPPTSPAAPTAPAPPRTLSAPTQPPPPGNLPQQSASVQPGQYFNAYTPVPAGQPLLPITTTPYATSSQNPGTSLTQTLLNLLQPVTSNIAPKTTFTVKYGTTSVGTSTPSSDTVTYVTVTPLTQNPTYSVPQTFSQTYLEIPRPSSTGIDSPTIGQLLDTLRAGLTRLAELLSLR